MPDDEIDLFQLFKHAWRGKWTILFCTLAALAVAVFYVRAIAVAKYASTTRLVIEQRDAEVVDLNEVISGVSTEDSAINTELQIIQSRAMIERLVRRLDLHRDPEFNEALREPDPLSIEALRAEVTEQIFGPPLPEPEQTTEEAINQAANRVSRAITVSAQPKTYLFDITVTTTDRRKSASMANTLAETYINEQVETKFAAVDYAVDWLSDRVAELEAELRERENQIKDLRSTVDVVSTEELEGLNVRAREIASRLEDVEEAVEQAREGLAEARDVLGSGNSELMLDYFDDPALGRIADGSDAADPADDPLFRQRVDALIERREDELDRQVAQRDVLQSSLEQLRTEIEDNSESVNRLNQMIREAEATRTLYDTFVARLRETSLQIGLQRPDSRILSPAIPGFQIEPRTRRVYILSIVIGALIGVGIVLLRQFAQNSFRSGSEIEALTGRTVIGHLPVFPVRRRGDLVPYLRNKPSSAASEAVRNLRTSVILSNPDNPPQVIMVTSSIPREGKTTTSVSLATNLAAMGRKVLLVEGDIRRNTLRFYFPARSGARGIVSVVMEEVPLHDALIRGEDDGADVLMGEKARMNAADFFSSKRFKTFMQRMRPEYDHIVVDTPPVLVVPDARVIAQQADAVIYVVRWNKTQRGQVIDGLQQLESIGIPVSGVVLSQIDPRGMKRYGYGGRYGAYATYGQRYYDN